MTATPSFFKKYTEGDPLPSSNVADWLLRRITRSLGKLSFDNTGQLRVAPANIATVTTVTTVTTMTTGNMGLGDMGKPATAMLVTRQLTGASTRRNLIRS